MKKRVGEYEKIFMVFPHPGNFYISLTAKREREQGSEQFSKPIGLVYFEAASGSDKTYPYFSKEFNNYDIQVESPESP